MALTTAMILCAGRGERMRPLTDNTPKPLLEVLGMPLLGWHLQRLKQAGFKKVVINHCWLGQQIVDYLSAQHWGLEIALSEEPVALETAGGIAKALPLLGDGLFAVVNGDIFCDFDFTLLPPSLGDALAHLVLVDNPSHNPQGDFAMLGQQLRQTGLSKLTFSGIAVYAPALFAQVSTSVPQALAPLLRQTMDRQKVSGQHFRGQWCDVGTPQRLAQLNGVVGES